MGTVGLIKSIKSTFRLFKQPHKIGDVINLNGKDYLIIGIERFSLWGGELTVWYTGQDLTVTDFISQPTMSWPANLASMFIQLKHDDDRLKNIELGSTCAVNNTVYKLQEYTEITLVGTDIKISLIGRPVYPVDRKKAKAKLFSERRKKLQLEIL